MKIGIFAKTFAGRDPSTLFGAASRAGYTAVQYNMACSGPGVTPEDVGRAAAACGVEIAAVSATYNMAHPDAAVRAKGQESLRAIAATAAAMGTRILTLCSGTRDAVDMWRRHPDNGTPEAWRAMLGSMEAAVAAAEEFDVELGVEPELANIAASPELARRLISELASPRIRIVLDAANLFEAEPLSRQREIVAAGIELLADRISIAHAKDRDAEGGFTTAGRGVLDYRHYIHCLRAAGFDGPLIAHGLAESEAADVARFLYAVSGPSSISTR